MLDENLPVYFLKPAADGIKHHRDVLLSHHGSSPAPSYALHNTDPTSTSPAHKNCYAVALFDAYNPEILFGEVLARPDWTQPTLNQEEIRRNGGIPPPPQPVLPHDFAVQLYNPDQQVRVDMKEGKWGASDSYEFSLPLIAFRTPSASYLDRGQSDPASLPITPKINFVWRKESKLSRDLTCYMTGKSTDTETKKKSKKDPDIPVALWRSMRELTIYESNMDRLELEDPKGMEVVLLLSAVVIKDLYFASKDGLREVFNVAQAPNERKLSGGGRKLSNPNHRLLNPPASIVGAPALSHHPPSALEHRKRKEKAKAEEAERKRLQRMVEEEEKVRRRKEAEVEKETERLRKLYGVQQPQPLQANIARPHSTTGHSPQQPQQQQRPQQPPRRSFGSNGLPSIPQGRPPPNHHYYSSSVMMSGANPSASMVNLGQQQQQPKKKKSSFFGLRSGGNDESAGAGAGGGRLVKKGSTLW
ncbi:hypothetical protein CERZMDRAFT_41502 [Cercospora zeae-maydis SCOH1-5]|uniref:Uncharacterized protein n=1 Tax=Cercospora zeae-maydis SCOH1-5 TaxID=717836 RepID=A0A6A6FG12_9PEZI|nr:hypothetical protein CERZMDRAFT_41502 [Cercospora zeae-maydis SCOH1-5]